MKLIGKVMFSILFGLLFTTGLALAQEDMPGSKDYPLLTKMPEFYISDYEEKDFDQADFKNDKGEDIKIEGHKYLIEYEIKKEKKAPGELQTLRNYENAVKKIGGSTVYETSKETWLKVERGGKTTWIYIYAHCDGECYELDNCGKESNGAGSCGRRPKHGAGYQLYRAARICLRHPL